MHVSQHPSQNTSSPQIVSRAQTKTPPAPGMYLPPHGVRSPSPPSQWRFVPGIRTGPSSVGPRVQKPMNSNIPVARHVSPNPARVNGFTSPFPGDLRSRSFIVPSTQEVARSKTPFLRSAMLGMKSPEGRDLRIVRSTTPSVNRSFCEPVRQSVSHTRSIPRQDPKCQPQKNAKGKPTAKPNPNPNSMRYPRSGSTISGRSTSLLRGSYNPPLRSGSEYVTRGEPHPRSNSDSVSSFSLRPTSTIRPRGNITRQPLRSRNDVRKASVPTEQVMRTRKVEESSESAQMKIMVPRFEKTSKIAHPVKHFNRAAYQSAPRSSRNVEPEGSQQDAALLNMKNFLQQFNKAPKDLYPSLDIAIRKCRSLNCNPSELENAEVEGEKILHKWRRAAYQSVEDEMSNFDVGSLRSSLEDLRKSLSYPSKSDGDDILKNDQTLIRAHEKLEDWLEKPEIIAHKMRRKAHESYSNKILSLVKNQHQGEAKVISNVRDMLAALFEVNEEWPKETHFEKRLHELVHERIFKTAGLCVKMFHKAVIDGKARTKTVTSDNPTKLVANRAAAHLYANRNSVKKGGKSSPTKTRKVSSPSHVKKVVASPVKPKVSRNGSSSQMSITSSDCSEQVDSRCSRLDSDTSSIFEATSQAVSETTCTDQPTVMATPTRSFCTTSRSGSFQMSPSNNLRTQTMSGSVTSFEEESSVVGESSADPSYSFDWTSTIPGPDWFAEQKENKSRQLVFKEDEDDTAATKAYEERSRSEKDADVKMVFKLILANEEESWEKFIDLGLPKTVVSNMKNKGGSTIMELVESRKKTFSSKKLQEYFYGAMKKTSICAVKPGDYVWYTSKGNVNSIMAKVEEMLSETKVSVFDLGSGERVVVDRAWIDKAALQVDNQ